EDGKVEKIPDDLGHPHLSGDRIDVVLTCQMSAVDSRILDQFAKSVSNCEDAFILPRAIEAGAHAHRHHRIGGKWPKEIDLRIDVIHLYAHQIEVICNPRTIENGNSRLGHTCQSIEIERCNRLWVPVVCIANLESYAVGVPIELMVVVVVIVDQIV